MNELPSFAKSKAPKKVMQDTIVNYFEVLLLPANRIQFIRVKNNIVVANIYKIVPENKQKSYGHKKTVIIFKVLHLLGLSKADRSLKHSIFSRNRTNISK